MIIFVVAFSLYFYYKSSGLFFLMLIATSFFVDWSISRMMARVRNRAVRLSLMWFSILLSLSILGYFKYANFFLWNWNMMVQGNFQPLDIILPVGISFYTFQSISYVVDVYKERLEPTRRWIDYLFFSLFFPPLWPAPLYVLTIFCRNLIKMKSLHLKMYGEASGW